MDNTDFFGGQRLEQDYMSVHKLHFVGNIRPGFFWAVAAGFGYGGRTTVEGIPKDTIQRNWRMAYVMAYPLRPDRGIAFSAVLGGNLGAGAELSGFPLTYQVLWGAKS